MPANMSVFSDLFAASKAAPNGAPQGAPASDGGGEGVEFASLIVREGAAQATGQAVPQSAPEESRGLPRNLNDQLTDLINQQIAASDPGNADQTPSIDGSGPNRPAVILNDVEIVEGDEGETLSRQPVQPDIKQPEAPVSEIPGRLTPPDRQGVELGDVEIAGGIDGAVPQPVQPGIKQPEAPVSEIPGRLTPPDRQGVELGDVEIAGGIDGAVPQPVQPDVKKQPEAPVSENPGRLTPPDRQGVELGDVEIAGGIDRTAPQPVQPDVKKQPGAPVSEVPGRLTPPDRQGVELGDVELAGGIDEAVPQPVQPGIKQPEAPVSEIPGRLTPPDRQGVELGDVEIAGGIDGAVPQPVQPGIKQPETPVSEIPGRLTPPDRQGVELKDVSLAGGVDRAVPHPTQPGEADVKAAPGQSSAAQSSQAELPSTTTLAPDLAMTAGARSEQVALKEGPSAAARAPGDLVREMAQSARSGEKPAVNLMAEPNRGVDTAQRIGNELASGLLSQAAKPSMPSPLQALLASAPLPAGMMSAMPGELGSMMTLDSLSAEGGELDAELSLEVQSTRAEVRAEAARATLPQGAAASRFTPQTVQSLAARIAARQSDGARVFDIRMDPPELGRVEVRLEVGADRGVRAHLMAERPDTLAELQRYARDLERALEAAGLELEQGGLDFSLRPEGGSEFDFAEQDQDAEGSTAAYEVTQLSQDTAPAAPATMHHYGFELAARSGFDVRT